MESLEVLTPEREQLFKEAVDMTLYLWDALSIAINNDPRANTPAIDDLRVNLREAILDEFKGKNLPPVDDLEELLFEFMDGVFEVIVDDESLTPTAAAIIQWYRSIARGESEKEFEALKERYRKKALKGGDRSVQVTLREENQETDGSDSEGFDEEDEDEDRMGEVVPQLVAAKEKPLPEVDEDGFTTVTRKR